VTYVTTPSGKIHITYVDNGTLVVVNINSKIITLNVKTNVTVGNEQYFLHVVGMAKGRFDNATIGVSKRGLVRVEKREGRNWVAPAG
jgi:hypothetical protein